MKITDTHIAVSPLTKEVFVVTEDKRRSNATSKCAAQRVNRTEEFVLGLFVWCPPGSENIVEDGSGKRYRVRVEEVASELDAEIDANLYEIGLDMTEWYQVWGLGQRDITVPRDGKTMRLIKETKELMRLDNAARKAARESIGGGG